MAVKRAHLANVQPPLVSQFPQRTHLVLGDGFWLMSITKEMEARKIALEKLEYLHIGKSGAFFFSQDLHRLHEIFSRLIQPGNS
jgi:hypothetical protein